jgi:predicted solute-binding protein
MVKETSTQEGSFSFNLDYYDEFIYRMDKNEIKNLDQLGDYKVLTGQSKTIRKSSTKSNSSLGDAE